MNDVDEGSFFVAAISGKTEEHASELGALFHEDLSTWVVADQERWCERRWGEVGQCWVTRAGHGGQNS